jgi:hypothetical protein
MAEEKDQEIQEVMEQEKRRGKARRPLDTEQRKQRKQLEAELLRAMRDGDERAFAEALRKAGHDETSPVFAQAWKLFRTR